MIKDHVGWELVGIYADKGISGTSLEHRVEFNRMIKDCLEGKIDLIVTKSVSRFARNTVDSLTTVRKLKDKGIEIYFEKENIWTLDSKGELLITIMSSLAQEESRSISENVTWGHRKRMADGKVSIPYSTFIGYDKGEDGNLVVNPEQAKTIKLIFGDFIAGLSCHAIAEKLTGLGIKTPRGKDKWSQTTVKSILMKLRTTDLIRRKRQHPLKTACYKGFCGQGGAFRLMCGAGKRAGMRIGPCTMDTITL
jgi:DNA invertase Pin-like site-specific DNA recombinase